MMYSCGEVASNGGRPVSISKSTTAERVEIGAAVDPLAVGEKAEVVGRGVAELADEHAGLRHRHIRLRRFGHAEVDDLHELGAVAGVRDHQILGADVAMDDAGAMDGFESGQRLDGDAARHAAARACRAAQHLREVLPFDELPDHVVRAVGQRGEIVQRGDVRMLDLRGQPRLAQEAVVRVAARRRSARG